MTMTIDEDERIHPSSGRLLGASPLFNKTLETGVADRLRQLSSLEQGWFDGEGEAIRPAVIELAGRTLPRLCHAFARPGIFPTISGGIQCEWWVVTDPPLVVEVVITETVLTASHSSCDCNHEFAPDEMDALMDWLTKVFE